MKISGKIYMREILAFKCPTPEIMRLHHGHENLVKNEFLRELFDILQRELCMTKRKAVLKLSMGEPWFIHPLNLGGVPERDNIVFVPYGHIDALKTDNSRVYNTILDGVAKKMLVPAPEAGTIIWMPDRNEIIRKGHLFRWIVEPKNDGG